MGKSCYGDSHFLVEKALASHLRELLEVLSAKKDILQNTSDVYIGQIVLLDDIEKSFAELSQKFDQRIKEKKKEAMKVLLKQEKYKALPKKIIQMKKDNFNKIGEFAINTNPKARLCNYLIVNEKIAGMIHIALGSGFEDDRASVYHYDVVINAKEQKLDIYGLKGNKKFWMMKKGKLVV